VFYISASVYAFGTIFYGLLGSGEIQPWAAAPPNVVVVENEITGITEEDNTQSIQTTKL